MGRGDHVRLGKGVEGTEEGQCRSPGNSAYGKPGKRTRRWHVVENHVHNQGACGLHRGQGGYSGYLIREARLPIGLFVLCCGLITELDRAKQDSVIVAEDVKHALQHAKQQKVGGVEDGLLIEPRSVA